MRLRSRSILLTSRNWKKQLASIARGIYIPSRSIACRYLYHLEIAVWCRVLFQECMLGTAAIWNTRQRTVTTIFWYDPIFLSTLQRSGGWKISWLHGVRRSTSALALLYVFTSDGMVDLGEKDKRKAVEREKLLVIEKNV